jgi:hypothetical protein
MFHLCPLAMTRSFLILKAQGQGSVMPWPRAPEDNPETITSRIARQKDLTGIHHDSFGLSIARLLPFVVLSDTIS